MEMMRTTENETMKKEMVEVLLPVQSHLSQSSKSSAAQAWEWTKLRKIIRRQIDKFIALVPETLQKGNLESVNKMRVTSRRLEQILDLVYPKPRPRRVKKLRRQLKVCRRSLSELRNYDALLNMAEESLALRQPSDVKVWSAVKKYLQEKRLHDAPMALKKLGQLNLTSSYVKLKHDLDSEDLFRVAATNGDRSKVKLDGGKYLINERLSKSLGRLWHEFEGAVEKSRVDPREEVIHRMRIAAKRLRYLTEAMEKLHIDGSSGIVSWLEGFQGIVGRWHDRELLEHAMTDMLRERKFRRDHADMVPDVEKLILHNRETKEALERKFSWMTSHSRHYNETKQWVLKFLTNGDGNGKAADQ